MPINKWKHILKNWINCYFDEAVNVNIESLFHIISCSRRKLGLDEFSSSSLEAQTLEEFVHERYPDFSLDNSALDSSITEDDLCIVGSLVLYFVCLNCKDANLKNAMCKNLRTEDQEIITRFNKTLMKSTNITYKEVQAAIVEACGQDTASGPHSIMETPPALRSLHGEVRKLQAALDAERFDRNYLQDELTRTNYKLDKLVKDKEQYKSEILSLKAKISSCCGQETEVHGQDTTALLNMMKQVRQLEEVEQRLVDTQSQLEDVSHERNVYKTKVDELKVERDKWISFGQQEAARATALEEQLSTEHANNESLKEIITDLRQHNQHNKLDGSMLECDDPNTSIHSFGRNLSFCVEACSNVVEVQLMEERANIVQLKHQIEVLQDQIKVLEQRSNREKITLENEIISKDNYIHNLKLQLDEGNQQQNVLKESFNDEVSKLNNDINELEQKLRDNTDAANQMLYEKMDDIKKLQEDKSSLLQNLSEKSTQYENKIREINEHIHKLQDSVNKEQNSKQRIKEDYETQVMKLKEKVLNRNNELVELQNNLSQNSEMIEELNLELRRQKVITEDIKTKTNHEIESLHETNDSLKITLIAKKDKIDTLQIELDENKYIIEGLRKSMSELDTLKNNLIEELRSINAEKTKLENDLDEKNTLIESHQSNFQILSEESAKVKKNLENQLNNTKLGLDNAAQELRCINAEKSQLMSNLDENNALIESLQNNLQTLYEKSAEDKKKFETQLNDIKLELEKATQELRSINAEKTHLMCNLVEKNAFVESLHNNLQAVNEELAEVKKELGNKKLELEKTNQNYNKEIMLRETLEQEIIDMQNKLQETLDRLTEVHNQVKQLNKDLEENNKIIDSLEIELKELTEESTKDKEDLTVKENMLKEITLTYNKENELREKLAKKLIKQNEIINQVKTDNERQNIAIKNFTKVNESQVITISTKNGQIATLQNDLTENKFALEEARKSIIELTSLKNNLVEELRSINDKKIQLEINVDEKNSLLESLQNNLQALNKKLAEVKKEFNTQLMNTKLDLENANQEIRSLHSEKAQLDIDLNEKNSLLESLQSNFHTLNEESAKIKMDFEAQLMNTKLELEQVNQKFRSIYAEKRQLEEDLNEKNAIMELLQSNFKTLNEESAEVNKDFETQLTNTKLQLDIANKNILSINAERAQLEIDLNKKNALMESLQSNFQTLNEELAEVKMVFETQLANTTLELEKANRDLRYIHSEKAQLEINLNEKNGLLESLQNNIQTLNEKSGEIKKNFDTQLMTTNLELENANKKICFINAEKTQLEIDLHKKNALLESLQTLNDVSAEVKKDFETQLTNTKHELENVNYYYNKEKKTRECLEMDILNVQKKLQETLDRTTEVQYQLNQVNIDLKERNTIIDILEFKLKDLSDESKNYKEDLEIKENDLKNIQEKHNIEIKLRSRLEKEITMLNNIIDEGKCEYDCQNTELNNFNAGNETLKCKILAKNKEISLIQQELSESKENLDTVKKNVYALETANNNLKEKCVLLNNEKLQLVNGLQEKNALLKTIERKYEDNSKNKTDKEKLLMEKEEVLKKVDEKYNMELLKSNELINESKLQQSEIKLLNESNKTLKHAVLTNNDIITVLQNNLQEKDKTCKEMDISIKNLNLNLNDLTTKYNDLMNEKTILKEELKRTKVTLESMQTKCKVEAKNVNKTKFVLKNKEFEIKKLSNNYNEEMKLRETLEMQIIKLNDLVEQAKSDNQRHKEENEHVTTANNTLQSELKAKSNEVLSLQHDLRETKKELESVTNELETIKTQIQQEDNKQNVQQSNEIKLQHSEIKLLNESNKTLKHTVLANNDQITKLENQLLEKEERCKVIKDLKSNLDDIKTKYQYLEDEKEQLEKDLKEKIESMQNVNKVNNLSNNKAKMLLKDRECEITKLNENYNEEIKLRVTLENEVMKLNSLVDQIKNDNQQQNINIEKINNDIEIQKQLNSIKDKEIAALVDENKLNLKDKEALIESLQNELVEFNTETANSKSAFDIKYYEKELLKIKEELDEEIKIRTRLEMHIKELYLELDESKGNTKKLFAEMETLTKQLQEKDAVIANQKKALKLLVEQNEIKDNSGHILDERDIISDLERIILDKNRAITTLQSDLTHIKSIMAESEMKVLDLNNKLKVNTNDIHEKNTILDSLKNVNHELQKSNEHYKTQLSDIHSKLKKANDDYNQEIQLKQHVENEKLQLNELINKLKSENQQLNTEIIRKEKYSINDIQKENKLTASKSSEANIVELEQNKNRIITTLQSDITYVKTILAESEMKLLDVTRELEVSKENYAQVSTQLMKLAHTKNDEINDLRKQINKMSVTENRATQIIKVSAKYQAMILKRVAEIKNVTVLKELTNFGNSCDSEIRKSLSAGAITMEELENFLETTDKHLRKCSEKQIALQKERDRLAEVCKISDSEIINMKKYLTELSVYYRTFGSVKELYNQKLTRVVSLQRTIRREILNLDGRVQDGAMAKLERGYTAVLQDLCECAMNFERWVERCIGRTVSPEKIMQAFTSELSSLNGNFQNTSLEIQLEEIGNSFGKLMEEISRVLQGEGLREPEAVTVMEVRAEYEDKLNRMKAKMKQLYQDQITIFRDKQKEEIAILENREREAMKKLAESSRAYEEHIKGLTSELWEISEKFLLKSEEAEWFRKKETSRSLMSLQHTSSVGLLPPREDRPRPSDTYSLRSLPGHGRRDNRGLHMSDEEGEVFDNRFIKDLDSTPRADRSNRQSTAGQRFSELKYRNSLCLPHLKSSYPAETQFVPCIDEEDIKCLNNGTTRQRKEVGITAYKKPGPPTPSKQAGRLSATGSDLRESLRLDPDNMSKKTSTPSRIKSLFRSSRNDTDTTGTPRRRLSIFRSKK